MKKGNDIGCLIMVAPFLLLAYVVYVVLTSPLFWFAVFLALMLAICIAVQQHKKEREEKRRRQEELRQATEYFKEISPSQLFRIRQTIREEARSGQLVAQSDFPGVYILTNKENGKHYVGQSIHVLDRLNEHFSGSGNKDVYYDFVRGDAFVIRMIPIQKTKCKSLNELERISIETYDAYNKGYNKNKGNSG